MMAEYDIQKVLGAIRTIHEQAELAKNHESDDFNWSLINEVDGVAQRAMYHLTRGEEGEKNHCELSVQSINDLARGVEDLETLGMKGT
jgi:hypothetical protein